MNSEKFNRIRNRERELELTALKIIPDPKTILTGYNTFLARRSCGKVKKHNLFGNFDCNDRMYSTIDSKTSRECDQSFDQSDIQV